MSKISDMYEQIKQQQYLLVKTKLQEAIKANPDRKKLSEQERKDYQFSDDEMGILIELLKKNGLDFYEHSESDYDSPTRSIFVMRANNNYIGALTDDWGGKDIPSIVSLDDLSERLDMFFPEELISAELENISALPNVNIDMLDVNPSLFIESKSEIKKIDIGDYVYDLGSREVIEDREQKIETDYIYTAYLEDVIYNILRNRIIDTRANAEYGETNNTCEIGRYSDMPGEEVIALILNSVDRKILQAYFREHPSDINLFRDMRKKYDDIQPIEETEQVKNPRQQFEDSLLREDIVEYYLSKSPEELEQELGSQVSRMVGFEQKNSHHCYDLWEHTLRTVEGIKSEGLTPEQFKKLRIAAFFHDIGKPEVASFNKNTGQQVFYGHAHRSVDVATPVLKKLGYSQEEIEQLGFYIAHHDDFISYKTKLAPFMKNHEFIRGIDTKTIAEKMIENKYNFDAMGYNKDEIRAIVYTLAHGKEPNFKTKDGPISIPVNMDEVRTKINSGKYNSRYDATLEDYQMLLQLCKADAGAQSEIAERTLPDGKKVKDGSKAEKLENMSNIENAIPEAYREVASIIEKLPQSIKKAVEQYTGYSFEEFIAQTKDGFKRPKVVMGDGVSMNVQASAFHYCEPRRSGLEAYESYEVGYPSEVIEQLREYAETPVENDEELLQSIYPFVPAEIISQIVMEHGGIDKEATLHPEKKLNGYKEEKAGMQSKNDKAAALINQLMAQIGNALEDYGKGDE